ncbi:MMPL family transporter [Natronococcus sp. A-GB7]|uniref:efflux RND transporter permease subunit n=1 Tax=Natronococcus sp. A-GB7 TaxID=3037649 RepID=UPI00241D8BFE|nr:MMPL family transporter [Natronococcus sp. A-GB7]MDG5817958.1 MMPL family transporter [Natronococcus sp. A-GB7]
MLRTLLHRTADVVTTHNHLVVILALVLTAGLVVGIANAEMGGDGGFAGAVETDVDEAEEYVQANYETDSGDDPAAHFPVYVRDDGGNALSTDALIATLEYQQSVAEDDAVADARTDDEVLSIASLVGTQAAGDPDASLDEQIAALEAADEDEVAALVEATLAEDPRAQLLVPNSYAPGTAEAESTQVVFAFEPTEDGEAPADAQYALADGAADRETSEFFTLGQPAMDEMSETSVENTVFLVLPVVLGLILAVAAFAYRDVVDVVVGLAGVLVSILWMFGILGWLGVEVGPAVVIGPVLIAGLSIDYGFHVFTRYREEREALRASDARTGSEATREQRGPDEPVRSPMARGLRAVAVAFGLVTITASIGFLANVVNPVGTLQDLGIAITLGVISAFVVFVTLVPALKVTIDDALERLGLDRHKRPLGAGAYVGPVLSSTVALARRAAPVVIVVALLVAAGGAVAWTALDEETMGAENPDVAEWKQELPGPVGWEENEAMANQEYVGEQFRSAAADEDDRVQLLVEGSVTDDDALDALEAGIDEGVERGTFAEGRLDTIETPAAVLSGVAAEDDEFASTVEAADTTGDGIPDSDLEAVYDHLYEVDAEAASAVIEREDGEYQSLRAIGPPQAADGPAVDGDRSGNLFAVGDAVETEGGDLEATVVSDATAEQASIERITDGIVRVMIVAVAAVFLALVAVYRRVHGSATLGLLTAVPVALVLGYVVGGMYLLDVPLNFLTALLVSLVIGIGVDYSIHLSDRFAHERARGRTDLDALEIAVTGTGGALLGSMSTSVAAFAGMLIHPDPSFGNFATLVVLAMVAAFVASVVVLPSLLYLWARSVSTDQATEDADPDVVASTQD